MFSVILGLLVNAMKKAGMKVDIRIRLHIGKKSRSSDPKKAE
jgi:hypothetical protein